MACVEHAFNDTHFVESLIHGILLSLLDGLSEFGDDKDGVVEIEGKGDGC